MQELGCRTGPRVVECPRQGLLEAAQGLEGNAEREGGAGEEEVARPGYSYGDSGDRDERKERDTKEETLKKRFLLF